jgi:phospholipase C
MVVVSPWTRGGWVNSQLFDHTSLIRFLEARFAGGRKDLIESNITPWRRAVTGDLTSAFDFKTPNRSVSVKLPDTDDFKPADLVRRPDEVPVPPVDPKLPGQERGIRPARAIPYAFAVDGRTTATGCGIDFRNAGAAAGVFHVRSAAHDPRSYTVEPHRTLSDTWDGAAAYDVSVHGPNGFFRRFQGSPSTPLLDLRVRPDGRRNELILDVANHSAQRIEIAVLSRYSGRKTKLSVKAGRSDTRRWSLDRTKGWYDLTITVAGLAGFAYRYAGHVEDGNDSITDPAMGGLI